MIITNKKIGENLKSQLDRGVTLKEISNWAYDVFINSRGNLSADINDILQSLFLMEAGPEFEYSTEELRAIANKLISSK